MRHLLEDYAELALTALLLMSVLVWGYLRVMSRAIHKPRVALIVSWAASIATVYLLGWSSPIRSHGMLRAFPLMSLVPLVYFWVKLSK